MMRCASTGMSQIICIGVIIADRELSPSLPCKLHINERQLPQNGILTAYYPHTALREGDKDENLFLRRRCGRCRSF